MKTQHPYGLKIWSINPCDSGFGEWESSGSVFVQKNTIKLRPDLDGLIRNQTGPAVEAETIYGPVVGMKTK